MESMENREISRVTENQNRSTSWCFVFFDVSNISKAALFEQELDAEDFATQPTDVDGH